MEIIGIGIGRIFDLGRSLIITKSTFYFAGYKPSLSPTSFGFFFCRFGNGLKVIGLFAGLLWTTYNIDDIDDIDDFGDVFSDDVDPLKSVVGEIESLKSLVGDVDDVTSFWWPLWRFESRSRISLFSLMSCIASELFCRPCWSLVRLDESVSLLKKKIIKIFWHNFLDLSKLKFAGKNIVISRVSLCRARISALKMKT